VGFMSGGVVGEDGGVGDLHPGVSVLCDLRIDDLLESRDGTFDDAVGLRTVRRGKGDVNLHTRGEGSHEVVVELRTVV
jgi:hypothetical protein